MIDVLIGLYNWCYFDVILSLEFDWMVCVCNLFFFVIMIDIDYFKKFNDMYGYDQGDWVFKVVVLCMCDSLCQYDVFCCYGGEEFFVILFNMFGEGVGMVVERLCWSIEELVIDGFKVIISLGIVMFFEFLVDILECFVEVVDGVFYCFKENGCNWVMVVIVEMFKL